MVESWKRALPSPNRARLADPSPIIRRDPIDGGHQADRTWRAFLDTHEASQWPIWRQAQPILTLA